MGLPGKDACEKVAQANVICVPSSTSSPWRSLHQFVERALIIRIGFWGIL